MISFMNDTPILGTLSNEKYQPEPNKRFYRLLVVAEDNQYHTIDVNMWGLRLALLFDESDNPKPAFYIDFIAIKRLEDK